MKLSTLLVPVVADRMYRFDRDIISEIDRLMTVDGFTYGDYHAQLMLAYKDDYPAVQMKIDDARVESEMDYDFSREKTLQSFRSTRTSALSPSDKAHMMKYLQLKYTILFLQRNKFIGKYCFYGCWCLPASASFEHIGYGEPVDQIDHSCKEFTTCYNCVYNQQLEGKRCDENDITRYSIKGVADKETKKITLFCHDPLGSCLRSRCECDKALAEKLAMHESTWNRGYHHKWGRPRFEPEIECKAKTNVTPPSIIQRSLSIPTTDQTAAKAATNARASRLTFAPVTSTHRVIKSAIVYGPIAGCCGAYPNVKYFRRGQKCCRDGEIVDMNAPCDIEFS